MLVTLSGIVTLVSDVQPQNAASSMLVTPSGIVTLVSDVQTVNALSPIWVTFLPLISPGITYVALVALFPTYLLISSVPSLSSLVRRQASSEKPFSVA